MKPGTENIFRVLDAASATDYDEGKQAYSRYKAVCEEMAAHYKYPLSQVVAVVAALSPNNDYLKNLRSAVSVIEGHKAGRMTKDIKVSTYNHCRDRAFSYLNGTDFLATTTGKKIRSFYSCILNPLDSFNVTIDGHAVNVWKNEQKPLKQVVKDGGFNYDRVADDFRTVARICLLLPNQVQAITWFAWKRIHRIYYPPEQFHLWIDRTGDFWRTKVELADIKPFYY